MAGARPFLLALLLLVYLPEGRGHRATGPRFLISDRDRDPQCNLHCSRSQSKPLCASDGRTYESMCDYQRAKCRESSLSVTHRGRCKDAGQSKCRLERAQALEQAKKPQEAVFIPECNEDGSFTQVQCHTYTGYCWCVTPDGKPISGSSVQNKTPVCSGSVTDKPSSQGNSGRKDDGSKPTPTMETQPIFDGEEITAPTLWIKHLVIKDSKLNSSSIRNSEKVHSCDQERQSALEEARQNPREGIVIPECAPGGLYKPVQCHQSTGYCWCVLVDTGRPLPGTSTRYETPVCESDARSKSTEIDDPFKDRELPGCPEGKKVEFITSLLDALTTDMVQAINSAAPTGGGRFSEPDPSHTLEERVVHWYFSQLDNNSSNDINKRELKPFKRYVKKKAKPKKCARRFTDYCDLNKDKSISLQELKGCLGVSKEGVPEQPIHPPSFSYSFVFTSSSSDETKTFRGSVSVSTKALLERFFWAGSDEEGLEGGKESHHFRLIYFITNECGSDIPNPEWLSSNIRTKMKWVIIPVQAPNWGSSHPGSHEGYGLHQLPLFCRKAYRDGSGTRLKLALVHGGHQGPHAVGTHGSQSFPTCPPRGQPKKEADEKQVVDTAQATEEQHGSSPGRALPWGGSWHSWWAVVVVAAGGSRCSRGLLAQPVARRTGKLSGSLVSGLLANLFQALSQRHGEGRPQPPFLLGQWKALQKAAPLLLTAFRGLACDRELYEENVSLYSTCFFT
ncbi:SPARC-related modular calcium-binding protein 1 [Podargus strigoides]